MSSTLVTLWHLVTFATSDHRKVEFDRIKQYELVHFNVDLPQSNLIEFDAFSHHYKVELEHNPHMRPSDIKHTNGIPLHTNGVEEYYTSLNESCHYYGAVLSDSTDPLQRVSLSFCRNRGIRGEIRAFNETIIIKPSKYYLDTEYDSHNFHRITDEHLIWKFSDFDRTDIPEYGSIEMQLDTHTKVQQNKRRMVFNNGNNQVELLLLSDPEQTKYYRETYGDQWYQELSADMSDNVNAVSSRYLAVDFAYYQIGPVSVHWVEFEVMFDFSGKYASFNPGCVDYNNCNQGWDYCGCTIDGTQYLDKLNAYVKSRYAGGQAGFDNAQLITKYYFLNAAGWGYVGAVCQTQNSCAVMVANYGLTNTVVGMAHEMGHNFGANHDGQGNYNPDCPSGQGMMGGSTEGFSHCSMIAFLNYFRDNNGLTCLGTGVRGGGTDPVRTPSPTIGGNTGGGGGEGCIGIANLDLSYGSDFNGYWKYLGDYDSKPYYGKEGKYLYFASNHNLWVIATSIGGQIWAYFSNCAQSDMNACSDGVWSRGDYDKGWVPDTDASVYSCDDTGGGGNGGGNCDYYNCIGLYYVDTSWDGGNLNKHYYPDGCRNGAAKYKNEDGMVLYRNRLGWSVYSEESDDYAYVYCHTESLDPTACANKLEYYNGGSEQWLRDDSSWVYDCSNQALNVEDNCDNIALYNGDLCFMNGLGFNESEWRLLDSVCENGMAVYWFESEQTNLTYYLHFEERKKYSDSNETVSKWMISIDEISDSVYAYCAQKDLLSCTEGQWYSLYDLDSDALAFGNEEYMTVLNGECRVSGNGNGNGNGNHLPHIVLVIGLLVLIGIVGFGVHYTFGRQSRAERLKSQMEQVADDEEEQPEIEVEVNMTTQTLSQMP